jgi:hypothetical protein
MNFMIIFKYFVAKWLKRRLQSWHLTSESWHWDGLRTSGLLLPTIE